MFPSKTSLLALIVVPLMGGVTPACADEPRSELTFRDASDGCNGTSASLERAVAVGARLDVAVDRDQQEVSVTGVEVDRSAVFSVERVDNPFALRALSAGTAVVTVAAAGTRTDLTLTAAPIASATVTPDPLTLWIFDDNLTALPDDPSGELLDAGLALLPDARLQLDVVFHDADGAALLGWDVADWRATPAGAVAFEPAADLSDDVIVTHGGSDGPVSVTTVGGGRYDLVLTSGPADRVGAWLPDTRAQVDQLVVAVGETLSVELLAWDAAGRLLLGNGPGGFSAHLAGTDASAVAELVAPPWSDEVELDADAEALLRGLRVVWIAGASPGQATVVFEAAGRTLELPVTVTP